MLNGLDSMESMFLIQGFRKGWRAYRETYYGHVRDKVSLPSTEGNCLESRVQEMVGSNEDLKELWQTLNVCYDRPEKFVAEVMSL
jgi:hypothetical protein